MDATAHFADIPARLWYDQYMILRQNALGDSDRWQGDRSEPSHADLLNGAPIPRRAPNDNFARELQELTP